MKGFGRLRGRAPPLRVPRRARRSPPPTRGSAPRASPRSARGRRLSRPAAGSRGPPRPSDSGSCAQKAQCKSDRCATRMHAWLPTVGASA
eukprot:5327481-Pleurochrysis_carterae.AAC.3